MERFRAPQLISRNILQIFGEKNLVVAFILQLPVLNLLDLKSKLWDTNWQVVLCKIPQVVQHKGGKSNGSFFLDWKFGKHETFQADKFWLLPQISPHSCRIGFQRIYQNDYTIMSWRQERDIKMRTSKRDGWQNMHDKK